MAKKKKQKPEVMSVRASSLPRIMTCSASKQAPDVRVNGDSDDAKAGRCVHQVLEHIVKHNLDAIPKLEPYAYRHGVTDIDNLRFLAWSGLEAWRAMRDELTILTQEDELKSELPGLTITGHPDVVGMHRDGCPVVIDWKSGDDSKDYRHQLLGYVKLAIDNYAELGGHERFRIVVVWLRERYWETIEITLADVASWIEELKDAMSRNDYCPSDQCNYCPLRLECAARSAMVKSAIVDLTTGDAAGKLTMGQLAELYPRAQQVKKAIKEYDEALKDALQDGALPLGDGRELFLDDGKRETILFEKGVYAASEVTGLVPTDIRVALQDSITISKKPLEDLAASRAPRGKKGEARKEIIAALRGAEAVHTTRFKRLATRKESKTS